MEHTTLLARAVTDVFSLVGWISFVGIVMTYYDAGITPKVRASIFIAGGTLVYWWAVMTRAYDYSHTF